MIVFAFEIVSSFADSDAKILYAKVDTYDKIAIPIVINGTMQNGTKSAEAMKNMITPIHSKINAAFNETKRSVYSVNE